MSDSKALRDAAAILLAEADKLDGKPSDYLGVNLSNPQEAWAEMLRQIAERRSKEVAIAKCYETHKPFWKAAERESWPSNLGGTFWSGNYKTAHDFKEAVAFLYTTAEGQAWLAHPLNKTLLPKGAPEE
jgi:hypothetical protein